MRGKWGIGMVVMAASLVVAGCRDTTPEVENAAAQIGNAAESAGEQIQNRAEPVIEEAGKQAEVAKKEGKILWDDGTITLKVKSAMTASDQLDTSAIDVTTMDQSVSLDGTVPTAEQSKLAEEIARNTVGSGVQVNNHLQVKPR